MQDKLTKFTPLCLLALYVVKSIVLGAGVPDAIALAFLSSLVGMNTLIDNIKLKSIMQADVSRLEAALENQQSQLLELREENQKAMSYVSSIKLQNGQARNIR